MAAIARRLRSVRMQLQGANGEGGEKTHTTATVSDARKFVAPAD